MNAITNMARLTRAGRIIAWSGARVLPDEVRPAAARLVFPPHDRSAPPGEANGTPTKSQTTRDSTALTSLGPTYIKLGQFLATRADLIGRELAGDLRHLQDRLPPFSMKRGAQGRRGRAGGRLGGPLRRVRPAGRRGLDRPGAQGGGARTDDAPRRWP